MVLALLRLLRGPSAQDRVLALDFLYVNGMLVMLVLGIRFVSGMYFDRGAADRAVRLRRLVGAGQVPAARRGDRMTGRFAMSDSVPSWVEGAVALLLLASGVLALTGALGLLRLRDFFQRMHPPALANTLAAWCAALASVVYFSVARIAGWCCYALVINILLAITAPVTTVLLARAALFRKRQAGAAVPPPLRSDTR